ncbi:MAG: HEAT repeat domain-containing protein [Phycisphaeraceae bacterium]
MNMPPRRRFTFHPRHTHHPRRGIPCLVALLGISALVTMACTSPSPAADGPATLGEAREAALAQVRSSADSRDPILRANALEAIAPLPDEARALAERGVEDSNHVVRFAALMLVGDLALEPLGEAALERLDDDSYHVRAAAIYAARAAGQEVDATPLARMLAAPDPGLRSNVAIVLGRMGDRSASPMMHELASAPMPRVDELHASLVRIQIAEALVKLGEAEALSAIRAAAYSHFDEIRVLALSMMGQLNDRRMAPAMEYMLEDQPIEIRLAAAEALARMGSGVGLEAMLDGADDDVTAVRAQAAFGLGMVDDTEATEALLKLLEDDEEQVRLSAAASIIRATSPSRPPAARW